MVIFAKNEGISIRELITIIRMICKCISYGDYNNPSNQGAATGTVNFGYFAGGGIGPFSTIGRLDYSNDTVDTDDRSFL